MKKPKLRELREAVTSLFSKPYTTDFPFKPHVPVKRSRGKPEYDKEECVGCGGCFQVCPSKAIEMIDEVAEGSGKRTLIHHPARCLLCGECERICITEKGIRLTNKFDISYFDEEEVQNKVEHKLLVCLNCGEIIGTEKHILWVSKKLGSLAFSQPITLSRLMEELEIKVDSEEKFIPPVQRTDIFKIVCPKCRRLAYLSDEMKKTE